MKPKKSGQERCRERLTAVRNRIRGMPRQRRNVRSAGCLTVNEMLNHAANGNGVSKLDMSVVWQSTLEAGECGSHGCAIGVTVTMFPKEARATRDRLVNETCPCNIDDVAGELLGLNGAQRVALFYGERWGKGGQPLEQLTGAEVAGAIDQILLGTPAADIWK